MAAEIAYAPVFDRPGGESCTPSRNRPVDLVHLARQTMGDREIEREVLGMFLHQIAGICDRMTNARPEERRLLAHGLVGSARGIGAFALAECAAEIEGRPGSEPLVGRLFTLMDEVREFIAAISR